MLGLEQAGVEFVACDMPHANRLTVGIMALVAEEERKAISQRTKAALAAAKARGVRLGAPKGTKVRGSEVGRLRGAKATAANAKQTVRKLDARLHMLAQRTDFRDFLCSARPQAAKFGHRVKCRGVFARSV